MRKVNLGHHLTQRLYNHFVQRGIPTTIVIEPNFPKDIFWKSQETHYMVIVPHLLRRLAIYFYLGQCLIQLICVGGRADSAPVGPEQP